MNIQIEGAAMCSASRAMSNALEDVTMSNDTPNPSVIQIPLTKGYSTIISKEDEDLLSVTWKLQTHRTRYSIERYAVGSIETDAGKKQVSLHRLILQRMVRFPLTSKDLTDHANGNTLDNRRENLRVATPLQNAHNRKTPATNTSGYKGVKRYKGKWCAYITCRGVCYTKFGFVSARAAAKAYNKMAIEYHGEFARLNIIEKKK
jgi:hypothetical protein